VKAARRDDERQRGTRGASAGRRAPAPDDGRQGLVSLVGSGPGDPDLLTCRAARRLSEADLVLHDGLVTEPVLRLAPRAQRMCVSRRPGAKLVEQSVVTAWMIEASRAGRRVVRLKAGDPFVLGRGGEEALALAEAHVPFEIVPGVSAAVAAPAVAGIPVTHRGIASGFLVVSGHSADAYGPVLEAVPPGTLTLVVLMGFAERGRIAGLLIDRGWSAQTPSAVVTNATQEHQAVWTGPLEAVGQAQVAAAPEDAHTIVVGEVVSVGVVIGGALWSSSSRSRHASGSEDTGPCQTLVCP
jgi:uroporphyrin-III C-methyltransferase/precorrin-2 dehydrogenase/sirohydrochlorin ferrochelatase